ARKVRRFQVSEFPSRKAASLDAPRWDVAGRKSTLRSQPLMCQAQRARPSPGVGQFSRADPGQFSIASKQWETPEMALWWAALFPSASSSESGRWVRTKASLRANSHEQLRIRYIMLTFEIIRDY